MPYFGDQGVFMSFLGCGGKERFFDFLEFFFASELATHAPAQYIAFAQANAREMVSDFDYVFLVNHDAVGFWHKVPQYGMGFFSLFNLHVSFDECAHHSASGHAGSDDAACGHQGEVIAAFEFSKELSHGWTFYVKTPRSMSAHNQSLYAFIAFELMDLVYVYLDVLVLFDIGYRVFDVS